MITIAAILLLWIIIFPLVVYLLLRKFVFKKGRLLPFMLTTVLWLVLTGAVAAIAVNALMQDVKKLDSDLKNNPKYLLYQANNYPIFGAEVDETKLKIEGEIPFEPLERSRIEQFQSEMKTGVKNKLIIIFNRDFLYGTKPVIEVKMDDIKLNIKREELIAMLESDDVKEDASKLLAEQNLQPNLPKEQAQKLIEAQLLGTEPDKIKIILLGVAVNDIINNQGPKYLIAEYRKGNLNVYPDYLVLKLLKQMPEQIVDKAVVNINLKR